MQPLKACAFIALILAANEVCWGLWHLFAPLHRSEYVPIWPIGRATFDRMSNGRREN